uniref:Proline rich 12 n=1 Tax=Amphilophus citrinellus TaxID=61819 RepID=A0A3Q0SD52_AMPCI
MERNYPASGFGDLGAGTGWSYDRSAKASLMYGSRSSHPDSELLHRQAYGTPLQGYAANHHPGSLSGLFDSSLHHASPSGPDPSVMNLISALESRAPQPTPSASSLLSQFRTPSWQTAMHTPAPTDLFISGALPGSSSFPSSSALSAYQHPSTFSGRSFTPSLSLQDAPAFSPTSNGLISPHDPLLHIKAPSQSSLGFDRLLSSQSTAFQGSQETPALQTQAPPTSSGCHLPPPQFNLLSSQLHNPSSQLYNASMFSSTPALPPAAPSESQPLLERAVSRQDSVIKHYQRSSSAHSTTLQQYANCSGSSGYQQIVSHHEHAGVSCSPLGEQSPSSDPKTSPHMESQTYRPVIQTAYTSSSSRASASSSSTSKGVKSSCSTSGYSSSSLASSSSCTPHTPPSTSSNSSSSSSNPKTNTNSLSAPSLQQPPPHQCLSTYGSQSVTKPSTGLPDQTPPQQHPQSYSPNLPSSTHMALHYGGFTSPHPQDLSAGTGGSGGKAFMGIGSGGRSFSAEIVFENSSFGSTSLRRADSPSIGYGSGSPGSGPGLRSVVGSAGSGNGAACNRGSSSYHLTESSTSPSANSSISRPGLHSPVTARPVQSPVSSGVTKFLSSVLSPAFMSSPQGFPDNRQSQSYHSTPPKPKTEATSILGAERSQDEEDDEDFLIHHLLHSQSSTSHSSQHHPHPQQLCQQISHARHGEGKGVTYDIDKISEERYHLQSVIRSNNTTTSNSGTNGRDSGRGLDRTGAGMTGGEGGRGDRHRQQHRLKPHHHHQQTASDLHNFLAEPDLDLSTPSQLRHINQTQTHPNPHALQHTQHTHHPLSVNAQLTHPHSQQMAANIATPQEQQQSQIRDPETQLSHSQLEQLKRHQFEAESQADKVGQNQAQQQRFAPLTSICFPDSLLHDEDRSFFPEMDDMFCSSEYKSSCAGDSGAGHSAQESLSQGHGPIQEGMEALKGGAAESYNMVGHHNNQGYGQYCQSLPGTGNGNLRLDLDSLKTHELPSTVNTDQLGLIQSQTSSMGLNTAVQGDGSVNKMLGTVGMSGSSNSIGLTSPIFCSSRPKKLLKTSSFHLLKQRREPQHQTKKNYAQEYEFGDDEDKADVPADIRLNSRRLPDLLPDLVSSCRKAGGASGISGLSPLIGDMDFCHPSSYSSLEHPPQLPPHDGPKKRGRKPTKPKREGPPRPRGRPRIRPLPEPPYCRGLMGSVAGENRRGRGRGRGRGRREEGLSLLRTDSLSSSEPILSDGSVGSAPSLGLSPGPNTTMDNNRNEADEKAFDFKPGFMASFLDFLKTGKKQSDFEPEHDEEKGGIRSLSPTSPPLPPTSPQQPPGAFSDAGQGEGSDLALSSCSSPCKPLDDELKRNLETLPSFSSDEEDSVSKNQDLQKSISSAISALYDTPHSLAAAMASAVVKAQPMLSPPTPQEPSLSPPLPIMPPLSSSMEDLPSGPVPASAPPSPSSSSSPPTYSSPSPLPPLSFSVPSPLPDQEPEAGQPYLSSPSPSSPSSSSSQPPSPPTPEETPASQRLTSLHLAKKQADAAIAGESEEEDSESGGEGIFRERDEFVVRTEDIGTLKMALQTGREPPPIWRVQKALLQKFSPEIKDGQRQFCATSNYLGYFGDAKMHYQRLYVKFLENVNKKDYVRVCSRKPWHRAGLTLRRQALPKQLLTIHSQSQARTERDDRDKERQKEREKERRERETRKKVEKEHKERERKEEREQKEKEKEERLKKENEKVEKEKEGREQNERECREKTLEWKKESESERREKEKKEWDTRERELKEKERNKRQQSEEEREQRVRETQEREWKERERPGREQKGRERQEREWEVRQGDQKDREQREREKGNELYLPPMRKIDSLLSERKKKLLRRVNMSAQHQEALHIFPKMTADPLESGVVKVHLGGEGYNRKTLNQVKRGIPKQQVRRSSKVFLRTCGCFFTHFSPTDNIEQAAEDPGQEEVVQQCMANQGWLESLFDSFMELLTVSAKA